MLISAQEREGQRIARYLHDDIGQRMALLAMQLQRTRQYLPASAAYVGDCLHSLWAAASDILAHVSRISHELHATALEHSSLAHTLRILCNDMSGHDIHIEFLGGEISHEIPKGLALCIYRVAQEALRNVLKHSGSREAKVELFATEKKLSVSITNSGKGFDANTTKTGLGLISMRERVRVAGGNLLIHSRPKHGTRVVAVIPYKAGTSSRGQAASPHPLW
jgi:signal transduction histidine kinase